MDTTFSPPSPSERNMMSFPVDAEHSGLRFSVIVIFAGVWLVTFFVLNALIPNDGLNILAAIGGFIVSGLLTRFIEAQLKERWPSGRSVEVDAGSVRLMSKGAAQQTVNAGEPMSILLWRFEIKRRNRVPKGWFVMACAIEQNDEYLPVYALVSPEQAETLNNSVKFTLLMGEKEQKAAPSVKQDSLRVAGEQRRLRVAEGHRWNDGVEMAVEDFERYINHLNGQFSQWMPLNR